MEVVSGIGDLPEMLQGSVIAIGNFDGVHLGHQSVINAAVNEAKKRGVPSGVMTFEPHPRQFFAPEKKMFRLTNEDRKLELFGELGLDLAIVLPFNKALSELSAEQFVSELLVGRLNVAHVVTGFDFYFGKGREGTPEKMRALGEALGFGVTVVDAKTDGKEVYSSSRIRSALRGGFVEDAAKMLGHWWQVRGPVLAGDGRGRTMGYPTINLRLDEGQDLKHGIYAVRSYVDGKAYHSAAYLGARPTFECGSNALVMLEAYLFDFNGDLYGKNVVIEFVKYIRGDQAFADADALGSQMALDCEAARSVLTALENEATFRSIKKRG